MASKISGKIKKQRMTCKCETCGVGFKNVQSLRSHQAVAHPLRKKRIAYRPKTEVIAKRKMIPSKKFGKLAKKVKKSTGESTLKKITQPDDFVKTSKGDANDDSKLNEFECPVCSKIFKVYFWAWKHIQRYHCIDEQGNPVSPTSKDIIKPLHIERCANCSVLIKDDNHTCSVTILPKPVVPDNTTQYKCLGCNQQFTSLNLYEMHIPGRHSDGAENLFFPDKDVLTEWREDIEKRSNTKYLMLSKRENTQVYHCGHIKCADYTANLCPASFTVQQLSKGLQLVFYKTHCGHKIEEYDLPDKFKKYSIIEMLRNIDSKSLTTIDFDSDNINAQFMYLMDDIVTKAMKIKRKTAMKVLYEKAVEMAFLLTEAAKFDDDCEPLKEGTKRPSDETTVEAKKPKLDVESKSTKTTNDDSIFGSPTSLASFNDSYKHFVVDTLRLTEDNVKKKKVIVKTKMGQFKPLSPSEKALKKSPIQPKQSVKLDIKIKPNFEYEVIERDKECNIMVIKI